MTEENPDPQPYSNWIIRRRGGVVICYCSVYDECWTSNLQDVIRRRQGAQTPTGSQEVESCTAVPRSAI